MISTCSGLEKSPLATGCNRPMTTTKTRRSTSTADRMSAVHMAEKNARGQPPRSSEEEAGGSKPRGPEAALHSVRMKRTPRVKLRVPLAPRVPFHTVMPPDFFFFKKKKRGGEIFHPAQSRSLIKRRFLLSFGLFTVRLAGNWVLLELIRQRRLEPLTGQRGGSSFYPALFCCFIFYFF